MDVIDVQERTFMAVLSEFSLPVRTGIDQSVAEFHKKEDKLNLADFNILSH